MTEEATSDEAQVLTDDHHTKPCEDCTRQMRQLSIAAAIVGAALGVGVAWLVLKNG